MQVVGLSSASEPYPKHRRPTPEECRQAVEALAGMHGLPSERHKLADADKTVCERKPRTVLDSLVATILSQNTTDVQSSKGFSALKLAYPTWEPVRTVKPARIEEAIRSCGLAEIKTARIQAILQTLHDERGECSLEYVHGMPEDEIKRELTRFNGVGPKTVACVLMFSLGRAEFPVDTHVWRISRQLGWVPAVATRETTYEHMNLRVPDPLKYDLHCLLVEHGKRCFSCAKGGKPRFEPLGPCPIRSGRRPSAAAAGDADTAPTPIRTAIIKPDPDPDPAAVAPAGGEAELQPPARVKQEPISPARAVPVVPECVTVKRELEPGTPVEPSRSARKRSRTARM